MKTKQLHHLHKSLIINLYKLSHIKKHVHAYNLNREILYDNIPCEYRKKAILNQGFKFVSFRKPFVNKCITYKSKVSIMTFY